MTQKDPEITAMGTIAEALADLDTDAQTRVLHWAARRFNVSLPSAERPLTGGRRGLRNGAEGLDTDGNEDAVFQDFVDLFDGAGPRTEAERALVGAYWFQIVGGDSD